MQLTVITHAPIMKNDELPRYPVPKDIGASALRILGCNQSIVDKILENEYSKYVIHSGGRRGKCFPAETILRMLPKRIREKVVIVKASDPVPKLRGNHLPRVIDYDMVESTKFSWELWDEIFPDLKNKRTIR